MKGMTIHDMMMMKILLRLDSSEIALGIFLCEGVMNQTGTYVENEQSSVLPKANALPCESTSRMKEGY